MPAFVLAVSSCFAGPCCAERAELRLPAVLSDGMVLQRESDVALWGWAEAGAAVRVRPGWTGDEQVTRADFDGQWIVHVRTGEAGGPYRLEIESGRTILLEDLWLGDVWLASGQSNMRWPLWASMDAEREIAAAEYPGLRLFDVRQALSSIELDDCAGSWLPATPESVREFSAVAYYFGRELSIALDVPIGLIHASWGGTPAEAWTSEVGLERLGGHEQALARLAQERADPQAADERARQAREGWWQRLCDQDPGSRERWMDPATDVSRWSRVPQPAPWSGAELGAFDGVVWMRRELELPEAWNDRGLVLELGAVDDMDTTWFQGERIGGIEEPGRHTLAREYAVPARLVRAGRAVLCVRVVDTGGAGGLSSAPGTVRLRPSEASAGESGPDALDLSGAWHLRAGPSMAELGAFPIDHRADPNHPARLFHGMIAPLRKVGLRGIIWYQGEANVGAAQRYERTFGTLIEDWREAFGQGDLPFLFVQIAPFDYGRHGAPEGASAVLRDAQRRCLSLANTGMVVTLDVGDADDIHPRDKQTVGRRLAHWALATTHGMADLGHSGPLFRAATVEGAALRVAFDHGAGLVARGGELGGFELADEDGRWRAARAAIEGETVVVRCESIAAPRRVRYAWGDVPEAVLFNAAGLPASTFVSD